MRVTGMGWWMALLLPALGCGGSAPAKSEYPLTPGGSGGAPGVPPPVVHAPPEQLPVELLGPELGGPSWDVRDISVDAGGGVWITARTGLFVRPPGRRFARPIGADEGMPGADVDAVGGLGPGVAVVTFLGGEPPRIVRLGEDESASVEELAINPVVGRIRTVDEDGDRLALVAADGALVVLDANGRVRGRREMPAPRVELWDVALDGSGGAWLGDQLRLLRQEGPVTSTLAGSVRAIDLVPGEEDGVVAVEVCPDGAIWASALGSGLFRLSPGGEVLEHLGTADGLPQDHLPSLACDPDGSLWIGSSWGGLARLLPDGTFRYHAATAGLPGDSIRRLLVVPDEEGGRTLWIATEGGAASYAGP